MGRLKATEFKEKVKKCLDECKEAVTEVYETYKETNEDVKNMTPEEEKEFLVEAFNLVYDEADKHFELAPVIDALVKEVAIPQTVNQVFKFSESA